MMGAGTVQRARRGPARSARHRLGGRLDISSELSGYSLAIFAATSAGDIEEIKPAGLLLDLRLRSHPPEDLLRISQEREYCGPRRRVVRLTAVGTACSRRRADTRNPTDRSI